MVLFCRWRLIVPYGLPLVQERIASCMCIRLILIRRTPFHWIDLNRGHGWSEYLKGVAYVLQVRMGARYRVGMA
jgi:hypothetical protein